MLFHYQIKNLPSVRTFHYIQRNTVWRQNDNNNILALVTEGKCGFKINNEKYYLENGDVFFIPAKQEYTRWTEGDDPCWFYYIHFEGNFLEVTDMSKVQDKIRISQENILQDISSMNYISANPSTDIFLENKMNLGENKKYVFDMLNMAYQDHYHTDITTPLILSLSICQLLAILNRITINQISMEFENTRGNLVPEKLKDVVNYIRRNYTRKITLNELSDFSGITSWHLIRLFRSAYNTTPIQYINNLKILHSKELLHKTRLPIKKIAGEIGIDDPYYFSRLYYKIMGEYPTAFRKRAVSLETNDKSIKNLPDINQILTQTE